MSSIAKFQAYIDKCLKDDPDAMKPDFYQPDGDGHSIGVKLLDGFHFPCFPEITKVFRELPDLPIRDDDVLISAFPKSGTNWIWEVCNMILRKSSEPIPAIKMESFIECLPAWFFNDYSSPRVMNTHLLPERLPKQMLEKRTKMIMLLRNPKDVAVSFYYHAKGLPSYDYSNGTFKGFFEVFLNGQNDYGSWFDYTLAWDTFFLKYSKDRQLILYFEDLKEDLGKYVRIIAKFLDVDLNDELANAITNQCGIKNMREAKMKLLAKPQKEAVDQDQKENPENMHVNSLASLFRKGVIGDWKNHFTVAQNERLDAMYKNKMGDCSFKFRYE